MYGSIHTHFESLNDTGNDLNAMLDAFQSVGAKKVAVTEHGVFTSFEDLKALCKNKEIKVIPGVEGYFTDTASDAHDFSFQKAHFILIAKDKEGYKSLCKIISRSNENFQDGVATTNWEILQQEVKKGHIFFTSACIQGLFGQILESQEIKNAVAIQKYQDQIGFNEDEIEQIENLEAQLSEKKKALKKEHLTLSSQEEAQYQENHKYYRHIQLYKNKIQAQLEILPPSYETQMELCDETWNRLVEIFGKENIYLEIQNHGMRQELDIYPQIVDLAKRYQASDHLIASNDIHVGTVTPDENAFVRRNMAQFNRFKSAFDISDSDRQLYIKDDAELKEWLQKLPIAEDDVNRSIQNISALLEQCETEYLYEKTQENHYPKFCENENAEFERLVTFGIQEKFPNGFPDERYQKRLEYEMKIIEEMGYAGYHLIVQDYLDYARNLGYLPPDMLDEAPLDLTELKQFLLDNQIEKIGLNTGPGRGSGVGSLCCYLLGISDIDPIQYGLLFERFLNPERKSMPDIDSDFRTDIREKTIAYCAKKYGEKSTCKIITKSYGAIKGNLQLAARYLGSKEYNAMSTKQRLATKQEIVLKPWYQTGNKLSKMIDQDKDLDEAIKKPTLQKQELFELFSKNTQLSTQEKAVISLAYDFRGVCTGYGQHAGGNIISKDDITDSIPLFYNDRQDNFSTQCTMEQAEAKGFLKMDFLGLSNLNILTDLMRMTGDNTYADYTKRADLLNDADVYKNIFATGLTHGVFQFESDGMKKMLKDFKPESFEDLILLVAAYRPGPMQFLEEIIKTKQFASDPMREQKIAQYEKEMALYRQRAPKANNLYLQYIHSGMDKKEAKHRAQIVADLPDKPVDPRPQRSININNDTLKNILAPTYGCIIYQEQVMKIFQELAGFSMGRADMVRKAMSKKHLDQLEAHKEAFIYGNAKEIQAAKLQQEKERAQHIPEDRLTKIPQAIPGCMQKEGISEKDALNLYEKMLDFARYAFNKSHATAYALISFLTAYYKEKYPGAFYTVSLKYCKEHKEVTAFASEMPHFGIHLKKPSLMYSQPDFWYDGKQSVYYGYTRVKGMPDSTRIINRPYHSMEQFIEMNPSLSGAVLIKLAASGIFDQFSYNAHHEPNMNQVIQYLSNEMPLIEKIRAKQAQCQEKGMTPEETELAISKLKQPQPFSAYASVANNMVTHFGTQYNACGFIFPEQAVMNQLSKTNPFPPQRERTSQKTGFVVVSIDPREVHLKNHSKPMHITLLMDKNYEIRKFFVPFALNQPYGQMFLNGTPWSLCYANEESIKIDALQFKKTVYISGLSRAQMSSAYARTQDTPGIRNIDIAMRPGEPPIGSISEEGLREFHQICQEEYQNKDESQDFER